MNSLFVGLLCLIVGSLGLTRTYTKTSELSPDYHISWNIVGDSIQLALQVNTRGWIGIGIGEPTSGSMPGADILTASIVDGKVQIHDRYAVAKDTPILDDCPNWQLISGEETSDGLTIIEVERKLDTKDEQDRPIVAGVSRIIFAFGSTDEFGYHGSSRHIGFAEFIPGETKPNITQTEQTQSLELRMNNFSLIGTPTYYGCQSFQLPIGPGIPDFHIIRIEPIIDPITQPRVHHFVLKRCERNDSWTQSHYNNPQACDNEPCNEYIWTWAPGIDALVLPLEAGFRMGWSEGAAKVLSLQVHYDNPERLTGLVDNSGVRIIYTSILRQYDAGVLQLGDPAVSASPIPAGKKMNHYEFNCPSDCTNGWRSDITIFYDFLHMHQLGKQMYTTHWRGDQFLGVINRVDFFDFGLQQTTTVKRVIKKGDRLNTHCVYDSTSRSIETEFAAGSTDEMCIDFVFYYPILSSGFCGYYRDFNSEQNYTVCGFDQPFLDVRNPTISDGGLFPITFGQKFNETCSSVTETMSPLDNASSTVSGSALILLLLCLFAIF